METSKPDVITLFAQEHETVVAFLNQGRMQFDPQVIYTAPHPGWGSSGIQVVDLDKDGDVDVLMTNGDTFDDQLAKPCPDPVARKQRHVSIHRTHAGGDAGGAQGTGRGSRWRWRSGHRHMRARVIDSRRYTWPPLRGGLEQTRPGVFERHVLEAGLPVHATLDVGDLDGDGDMDIVVGNWPRSTRRRRDWSRFSRIFACRGPVLATSATENTDNTDTVYEIALVRSSIRVGSTCQEGDMDESAEPHLDSTTQPTFTRREALAIAAAALCR